MSDIKIGKLYQYDNKRTLLTGDQLVEVTEDTRGTLGGGIIVKSKATGTVSKVDRSQLHEYEAPPPLWKKIREQFLLGLANKLGLLLAATVGAFASPYLGRILKYFSSLLQRN